MKRSAIESQDPATQPLTTRRARLRFEFIFASVWLAIGLFALPALIFGIGQQLLGRYGEGSRLGRFYVDFFADLAEPAGRAWTIALGPLILITLVRLVFIGVGRPTSPDAMHNDYDDEAPHRPSTASRVEPRLGPD